MNDDHRRLLILPLLMPAMILPLLMPAMILTMLLPLLLPIRIWM